MGNRVTLAAVLLLALALVAGCGRGQSGEPRVSVLRHTLVPTVAAADRAVPADLLDRLPDTAPVYRVDRGELTDLQQVADWLGGPDGHRRLHVGRDTTWVRYTDGSTLKAQQDREGDTTLYDNFRWYLDGELAHQIPPGAYASSCTPIPDVDRIVSEFWRGAPSAVAVDGFDCLDGVTRVRVALRVDGAVVASDYYGEVDIDDTGTVISAAGAVLKVRRVGQVPLAPAPEIQRRADAGLDAVDLGRGGSRPDGPTGPTRAVLVPLADGGLGMHDHTPGNVTDSPGTTLLVPGLDLGRRTAVITVATSALVTDPDDAGAADEADRAAGLQPDDASFCGHEVPLTVCASDLVVSIGQPVVLSVDGEVSAPVGHDGCSPRLVLMTGDDHQPVDLRHAVAGTQVAQRVVHTYTDPGTYQVQAVDESRCPGPDFGDAGAEFDYRAQVGVTITVRPVSSPN